MGPTKLSYFNVTALGEPIRYLLSYGGIEFEDDRHTMETFQAIKDSEGHCFIKCFKINFSQLKNRAAAWTAASVGVQRAKDIPICLYLPLLSQENQVSR
jgi:hypothetical protein